MLASPIDLLGGLRGAHDAHHSDGVSTIIAAGGCFDTQADMKAVEVRPAII